jgi:hypothetical protein
MLKSATRTQIAIYTLFLGITSGLLYFLLYWFEDLILEWSKHGGWYFLVPILMAFTFSLVHGNFTSHFWDLLGVKAKSVKS